MRGLFLILLFVLSLLKADEVRPLYLELKEHSLNNYLVTLKIPAKGNKKLKIEAKLPKNCTTNSEVETYFIQGAYLQRWSVECKGGLSGKPILLDGLKDTNTDLLLRIDMLDGSSSSTILNPTKTSYSVPVKSSNLEVVSTYTWLGITHILMGYDHLAFVFALLLLVSSMRKLLWTVTAFTLAHSITMAGATLGIVEIPQKPVEAVIALSILFLALEVIHKRDGKHTIASSYPWVVAFIFGLLHGFGFAGALAEIGLPQNAITIALLFFNIGVEIGQLIFIVSVVTIAIVLHKLTTPLFVKRVELIAIYIIGTVSSFWLIDRVFGIVSF
jgi:hydrogenase/urease accessory protein HupE